MKKKGNNEEMERMKENEGKHRRMAMKEIKNENEEENMEEEKRKDME